MKFQIEVLKSKIHRVSVTQADLNYVGSITIDEALLEAANILEGEKVQIMDINNGERFETYTIKGERNSGCICLNGAAARKVQQIFTTPTFRVYTNTDRRGVELGGAVKNVIALAVGIAMGLDYGDNAKAALITRGNAELARLGVAMGCKAETFAGLSGMGDLIVTCTSMHSRNLHAGMLIGRGKDVETAKKEVGQVVEGINALPAACKLAKKYKVEMPIVNAVDDILSGRLAARDALATMMGRQLKQE